MSRSNHGQQTNIEGLPVLVYVVSNLKVKSQNAPGLVKRFLAPFTIVTFLHYLKLSIRKFSFYMLNTNNNRSNVTTLLSQCFSRQFPPQLRPSLYCSTLTEARVPCCQPSRHKCSYVVIIFTIVGVRNFALPM